jgi:hypothetical protein
MPVSLTRPFYLLLRYPLKNRGLHCVAYSHRIGKAVNALPSHNGIKPSIYLGVATMARELSHTLIKPCMLSAWQDELRVIRNLALSESAYGESGETMF